MLSDLDIINKITTLGIVRVALPYHSTMIQMLETFRINLS